MFSDETNKSDPGTSSRNNLNIRFHYNDIIGNTRKQSTSESENARETNALKSRCGKRLKFTLPLVALSLYLSSAPSKQNFVLYRQSVALRPPLTIILDRYAWYPLPFPPSLSYSFYRFISRRNRFEKKKCNTFKGPNATLLSPFPKIPAKRRHSPI